MADFVFRDVPDYQTQLAQPAASLNAFRNFLNMVYPSVFPHFLYELIIIAFAPFFWVGRYLNIDNDCIQWEYSFEALA